MRVKYQCGIAMNQIYRQTNTIINVLTWKADRRYKLLCEFYNIA